MSLPRVDHIVIAVRDLGRTVAAYEAAGFTVTPGGRHPGRNTENALVVFDDGAYLELITYHAPSPDERWWRELDAHGDGLVDFALWPHDIEAAVAQARARGFTDLVAKPGGRVRPDGTRIEWQTARQVRHDLPFLCADVTPRSLRVPEGDARRHANGATGVADITVAVQDVQASLRRYRAFLGDDVVRGDEVAIDDARIGLVHDEARARDQGPCAVRLHHGAVERALAVQAG